MSFEYEIKEIINNNKNTNHILFKYTWGIKTLDLNHIINTSEITNKFYIEYLINPFPQRLS